MYWLSLNVIHSFKDSSPLCSSWGSSGRDVLFQLGWFSDAGVCLPRQYASHSCSFENHSLKVWYFEMVRSLLNGLFKIIIRLSSWYSILFWIRFCLLFYRLKYLITISVRYLLKEHRNTHSWKTWKVDLQLLHCSNLGFLLSKLS